LEGKQRSLYMDGDINGWLVTLIDGWMMVSIDGWMVISIDRWMDGDINLDYQCMDRLKDRQYCTA